MEEAIFIFQTPSRMASTCLIRIDRELQIVIATETQKRISITTTSELMATELVKQYQLMPQRLLLIEHYPESTRPQLYGESYYLVTFTWVGQQASKAIRQPLPLSEFKEVLQAIES
ncbi:hypothetical protein G8759_26775 [Spirosoma aureum]|uniref:Uncharacterized protein n=1 Tax=Spirosoma aureum TaxID=2692134 RepID=A0A6G9AU35_9BACT|nr:hypothetical protein [Spirosoma aureum]QIP15981.1 hypothetical protein G8759_26775 [Spirosoma aureum]